MNKLSIAWALPALLGVSFSVHAAEWIAIESNNFSNYLKLTNNKLSALDNRNQFVLQDSMTLSNGLIKKKYAQYFQGVRVYNSVLTSSDVQGIQQDWFGHLLRGIKEDIGSPTPAFDSNEALSLALKASKMDAKTDIQHPKTDLLIRLNHKNKAELVYLISFYVDGAKPTRPFVMLNAKTGKVIDTWEGLATRDAEGPGGNEKIGQYYYGKDYGSLIVSDKCEMLTPQVETYNMKNQTEGTGELFKFTCPVNTYKKVNGAFSPLNDAHYFGMMVFEMYQKWYKMSPLNTKLKMKVHYGKNFENAFWDGESMTYGDGGNKLYPLTSLDVVGHEVSHGVTEHSSGLVYKYQSGGINEAFSDMAGETAEAYMNEAVGKENDWLIGASIFKGGADVAMRYFKNPTQDGYSIDHANDYNDSLDVHHSSGVYNKAFYTLATKPNWTIKKAFEVFLTANKMYWEAEATFDSAACGVKKAAADLKYDEKDIIASFKEVGVNANCNVPDPDPDPDKDTEVELSNGTTVNQIKVAANDEHKYFINVPIVPYYPYTYNYLYIKIFGGGKDVAELYVRYDNGLKMKLNATADDYFYIKTPLSGKYHILIKGKKAGSVNLQAYYG